MKTRILLFTLCVASSNLIHAQQDVTTPTPVAVEQALPPGAMGPLGFADALKLTPEQVRQLEAINQRHTEAMIALGREGLDEGDKHTRSIALRDTKLADTRAVLSEEQFARWQQLKQARRDAALKQRGDEPAKPHQE